jgi:hypothetical protein
MTKNTMKLGIIFEAPFTNDKFDKHSTAPAFASLRDQIITYADALKKDPNVIIVDAFAITEPGDYGKRATQPADSHIAELKAQQTENINKETPKPATKTAKAPATGPVTAPVKVAAKVKAAVEPEKKQKTAVVEKKAMEGISFGPGARALEDEDTKPAKSAKAAAVAAEDVDAVLDKIFENLKRTEKSVTIVTALAKAGGEVSTADLVKATKINGNDLGSWLSQTGKSIKALEKVGRGKYRLDFAKV